ncbi:hypothetical protein [Maribacter sp. 2307UL18-2]|uniref:hypothetical protein n=1 Tax=Maribacter sp. 2307UL18-2 TaxID=3386274 RepID=UPI0039BCBB5B
MELEIDTCIDLSSQNNVTFVIENPTDSDIWINPLYLTFYFGVYSEDGNIISRKTTRPLNGLESEYVKVEKKSKKELNWRADFFDNYQLELNKKYYLECGYEPPHLRRKDKRKLNEQNIILSENRFDGKSKLFRICEI